MKKMLAVEKPPTSPKKGMKEMHKKGEKRQGREGKGRFSGSKQTALGD